MTDRAASQTCYRCKTEKPIADFTQRVDDRHYRMCQECVSSILTTTSGKKERLHHTDTHRTCYLCRRLLPVAMFTRRTKGNYFSGCKECNRHVFAHRRRARLQAAGGAYTVAEWNALVAQYDRCPDCRQLWSEIPPHPRTGIVITVDHIIPIARSGRNTIDNIRPLCYSCNSKKGAR